MNFKRSFLDSKFLLSGLISCFAIVASQANSADLRYGRKVGDQLVYEFGHHR